MVFRVIRTSGAILNYFRGNGVSKLLKGGSLGFVTARTKRRV